MDNNDLQLSFLFSHFLFQNEMLKQWKKAG